MNAKKKHAMLLVAVTVITMVFVAWSTWRKSPSSPMPSIPPKPEGAILEFWIAEDVKGVDWAGHDIPYGMFGGEAYLGKDYPLKTVDGYTQIPKEHIIYTVTAWPDFADGGAYVTGIEITDPAIAIYGLTVNSSFDEFDRVFREQDYCLTMEKNEFWEQHWAAKDGITFSLQLGIFTEDGDTESIFTVSAEVSNRENIVF